MKERNFFSMICSKNYYKLPFQKGMFIEVLNFITNFERINNHLLALAANRCCL